MANRQSCRFVSLHAGVSCEGHQRDLRERLCRYIARPAVAEKRLTVNAHGKAVYLLKAPYRDGTTHVVFEPLDFIARLAALVPRPRVNLTRYHGVLAPNHRWRAEVTPSGRGRRKDGGSAPPERSAIERHAAMTWARRLKRVFGIDVESCIGAQTMPVAARRGAISTGGVAIRRSTPYRNSSQGLTRAWIRAKRSFILLNPYSRHKPFEHIYRHHRRYRITEGADEIQMRKIAGVLFGFLG